MLRENSHWMFSSQAVYNLLEKMHKNWNLKLLVLLMLLPLLAACGKGLAPTANQNPGTLFPGGEYLQGLLPFSGPTSLALDKNNTLWIALGGGAGGIVAYVNNGF